MKKTLVLLVLAAFGLVCQSQAEIRWALKYTNGHHHVNAIITTGDFDATLGGYPMTGISGERDGVKIAGITHGYVGPLECYQPYDPTTNPIGGSPRYALFNSLSGPLLPPPVLWTEFDNVVMGGKTGFDFFGLSFTAGGLEYNVYSDGVTVWELDQENDTVVTNGISGEVVTHFEIRQLPKGCDNDDCGHNK